MRLRILAIALLALVIWWFGRGGIRFAVLPVAAVFVWIGLDVLFGASLSHAYRLVARQRKARFQPDPFPRGPRLEWTEGVGASPHAWHVLGPIASGFAGRIARTRMLTNEMRDLPVGIEITSGRAPRTAGRELEVPPGRGSAISARIPDEQPPGRATEFLDAYTAVRVRALADRVGPAGLRVRISQGRVLVDVGRVLRRADSLNLLIDTAAALRDRARALAGGGAVTLRDEARAKTPGPDGQPAERPRACAVCFEPMEAAGARQCQACGASHHRDCFEWAGRCGAFSCAGTELVSASHAAGSPPIDR